MGLVTIFNYVNSNKETEKTGMQKVRRGVWREAASRIHVAMRDSA